MILGGAEAHEIEEVFLIVKCHVDAKLLENCDESLVTDQVASPVLQLPFAFEAEPVEGLWLDIVAFEKLKDPGEEVLCIARILVDSAAESVKDHVLLLSSVLKITYE